MNTFYPPLSIQTWKISTLYFELRKLGKFVFKFESFPYWNNLNLKSCKQTIN